MNLSPNRHLRIVPTDQGVQIYRKGKLVTEGPLHEIRQWLDDNDQIHYLSVWARTQQRKKKKRAACRAKLIKKYTPRIAL